MKTPRVVQAREIFLVPTPPGGGGVGGHASLRDGSGRQFSEDATPPMGSEVGCLATIDRSMGWARLDGRRRGLMSGPTAATSPQTGRPWQTAAPSREPPLIHCPLS